MQHFRKNAPSCLHAADADVLIHSMSHKVFIYLFVMPMPETRWRPADKHGSSMESTSSVTFNVERPQRALVILTMEKRQENTHQRTGPCVTALQTNRPQAIQ
jgi:hypothetical protein